MNSMKRLVPVVAAAVLVAMLMPTGSASGGSGIDPDGMLFGYGASSKAKVSRVGKAYGHAVGAVQFAGGQWGALERDDDGNEYWFQGTYSRLSGKKLALRFDAASVPELERSYENWYYTETGEDVTVRITSISATVKLKNGGARAKAKIKVTAQVSGDFGTRRAKITTKIVARLAN